MKIITCILLSSLTIVSGIAGEVSSGNEANVQSKKAFFENQSQQDVTKRPLKPQHSPGKGKEIKIQAGPGVRDRLDYFEKESPKQSDLSTRPSVRDKLLNQAQENFLPKEDKGKDKIKDNFPERSLKSPKVVEPWRKSAITPIIPQLKVSFDFERALKQGDQAAQELSAMQLNSDAVFWLLKDSSLINNRAKLENVYEVRKGRFEDALRDKVVIQRLKGVKGTFTQYIYRVYIPAVFSSSGKEEDLVVKGVKWISVDKISSRNIKTPVVELQLLEYLRESGLADLSAKNVPFMPFLALPLKSFWYQQPSGVVKGKQTRRGDSRFADPERNYVTISPYIRGKSIYDIMMGEQIKVTEELQAAFYHVGKSLGTFHFHMARPESQEAVQRKMFDQFLTTTHGDFHSANVFYNSDNAMVNFIDLADMAESHRKPMPFWHDIYRFYVFTKYKQWLSSNQDLNQFNDLMDIFIEGYSEAFPQPVQNDIKIYLTNKLKEWTMLIADMYEGLKSTNYLEFVNAFRTIIKMNEDRPSKVWHNPEAFSPYLVISLGVYPPEIFANDRLAQSGEK